MFLGANQDAYATGSRLAVAKGAVSNFKPDARGVRAVYSDLNQAILRMRRAKRKAKSSPAAASALPEVRAPSARDIAPSLRAAPHS